MFPASALWAHHWWSVPRLPGQVAELPYDASHLGDVAPEPAAIQIPWDSMDPAHKRSGKCYKSLISKMTSKRNTQKHNISTPCKQKHNPWKWGLYCFQLPWTDAHDHIWWWSLRHRLHASAPMQPEIWEETSWYLQPPRWLHLHTTSTQPLVCWHNHK